MGKLVIIVEFEDDSDMNYARVRCIAKIEDYIEDLEEANKFDGKVSVDWDILDNDWNIS